MISFRRTLLAAVAVPALLVATLSAQAETIQGAMAKAYANNPDVNAARASLRATDENVTIAKAAYRPQIGITAAHTNAGAYGINNVAGADRYSQQDTISLTVTQQIFDGFQGLNRINAAESGVYATREQVRGTEMQILYAAVQAYANIALYKDFVSIRKQNLGFLNEQVKAANARLQVGEGTKTDVSQAQAQLAAAQAQLAAAVAQQKIAEATYMQIVGEEPKGISLPAAAKRGMPATLDKAVSLGLQQHPSILAAQHVADSSGYQVKSAEGALLPGVAVQAGVGRTFVNPAGGSSAPANSASVTAQLTIPLYKGGAEYGAVRQAKETMGANQIKVDSARLSVRQSIVSAYAQMQAASAAITANKQAVSASNLALSGVIEERNVGQATTLDVLNSQQTVLTAKLNLAQAQHDLVVASYGVLAASGQLTVQTQGLQVAEYKPEEHYEAVKDAWIGLRTVDGN
ncbi:TolC family outer membrane protein [Rhizobium sp. C4]|uniref:TolC family outer membrane protein n=1 Tax=Rhizobium sp. C4 TaxID=1349800 RepID=UPI001E34EBE4|nr:TolC family outer membrane protein [Rhizobium sp. C4]MCD2176022.1 TolC family outer membrane protein [Rhizobium sp. C4]